MNEEYPIMGECADYIFENQPDGSIKIIIEVPKRFAELVRNKLMGLKTNDEEIAYYEDK